ncbi:MAG: selenocysteine-specific translation elongation factor, partial [Chloroflexota bacterium]
MTLVIGTAGHIDHGKTTLLRALTGIDTDRLPEEQRRGLTIDIGFAHFSPDGAAEIDFVDVPGHDKLVGNMLVGAGEIDAAMIVVAADDGPREQTWEHLGLLDAMGISEGLVVVTKIDLVEAARVTEVAAQVRQGLEATTLSGVRLVAVSATNGEGLDDLRSALAALRDSAVAASAAASRVDRSEVRLGIDRVFSVRGRGTVVTGTSRGRVVADGERLRALPEEVGVRVRGIQTHHADVDEGPLGGRVALNLAGAAPEALRRGQVLVSARAGDDPLAIMSSERMLVALRRPAPLPSRRSTDRWPPTDGFETRLHIGTDQVEVALGRSGRDDIDLDDGCAVAILRLDRPVAAGIGARFVLRRPPPARLLAGGIVLDPMPMRGRSRHRQTPERVQQLADAVSSGARPSVADALLALRGILPLPDGMTLAADVADEAGAAAIEAVEEHHVARPDQAGMPLSSLRATTLQAIRRQISTRQRDAETLAVAIVDTLLAEGQLLRLGDEVRSRDHQPPSHDAALDAAMDRLETLLDTSAPPSLRGAASDAGCPSEGFRELER